VGTFCRIFFGVSIMSEWLQLILKSSISCIYFVLRIISIVLFYSISLHNDWSFFSFSFLFSSLLPTCYMCKGLMLDLITLRNTFTLSMTLWTRNRPVAKSILLQHTTFLIEKVPCRPRNSNPQSQQASDRRPSPLNARPTGSAMNDLRSLNKF